MVVYVHVDAEIFFFVHFHFRTYSVYTMEPAVLSQYYGAG